MVSPFPSGAARQPAAVADDAPATLVLPLAGLQTLWHHRRSGGPRRASADSSGARLSADLAIAHGSLVLQAAAGHSLALAGPLRPTPLADAWTPPDPLQGPRDGVCLVVLASARPPMVAPTLPSAEDWLQRHASAWRLSSRALRPALALLWMSDAGEGFLGWRSATGRWSAMAWLDLPGSGLRRVFMGLTTARPVMGDGPRPIGVPGPTMNPPPALPPDAQADPDLDRYSRQRLALGAPVLHTLQHRSTVVIGLGRTGSPLVHSAVRLGMPVLGLDPDVVEPHNLDGDFSPLHEGWTKAAALRKQLTPLARPGAAPDLRALDVASPAAGALIAATDGAIVTAVDNSRALLWANAWALALGRVHIVIASGLNPSGGPGGLAEAELRVLLPGEACVLCAGGLAEPVDRVLASLGEPHAPRAAPFSDERPGSLRSWSVLAGHHALRALEQVAAGRVRHSLFRRLTEQDDGGLRVEERTVLKPVGGVECPMCRQLGGAGLGAVSADLLRRLLESSRTP